VGMLSQATGRKVDRKSAFTGEISLSGTIQPVGGIPGKLAAAYLGGLQRVFMPAKNLSDLAHVSMSVKKSLEIVLVRQVEEVWSSLWP
jgi:ATP-dependent Lon protease